MTATRVFSLAELPVHLGLGATVVPLDPITGPEWYEAYGAATAADGTEGRLVSLHTFTEPWDSWEMHPLGSELVACLDGTITVHQEHDTGVDMVTLHAGDAVINDPGVWHTADVEESARVLFITAGEGTQNRPR